MLFSFSTSSDITRSPPPPQHQVFINFRGADVREGFLKTLLEVLRKEQVNVYVDSEELRGKDLKKVFFKRIEKSKIAITIFSDRYTDSKWCLDELVKIKECMDKKKLRVFPIFFNVKTDDVNDLEGNFGRHFRILEAKHPKANKLKNKWKDAIKSVSGRLGLTSQIRYRARFNIFRYFFDEEKDFAELIAEETKRMLKAISEREARRKSLLETMEELIISVVPGGVQVFALVMFVA